jgi:hypothetical protein
MRSTIETSRTRREELPHTLLTSLRTALSHPSPQQGIRILIRTLLFLHASVKSLSSNRMPKGRSNMIRLADMLFSPLVELHNQVLGQAVAKLQSEGLAGTQGGEEEIEAALLAFKTLRYLLLYGYGDPSLNNEPKVRIRPIALDILLLTRYFLRPSSPPPCRPSLPSSPSACNSSLPPLPSPPLLD